MADSYRQARADRRAAENEIKADRSRGKPASNPSLQKRGDAITRQADLAKPPINSRKDWKNRK